MALRSVLLALAAAQAASSSCPAYSPGPTTLPDTPALPAAPSRNINAWIGALSAVLPELTTLEVPPTVRATSMIDSLTWSCIATYHPTWTDAVLVGEAPILGHSPSHLHTSDPRSLCLLHAFATLYPALRLDSSLALLVDFTQTIGVNVTANAGFAYEPTSDVAMCFDAYTSANEVDWDSCARPRKDKRGNVKPIKPKRIPGIKRPTEGLDELRTCLAAAASCRSYDPAFVGPAIARFFYEYFATDGFNADGQIGKDGTQCTANCRPFSDYTAYFPVNHPGSESRRTRWEPLLEDNNDGFFYRQEHVAPHVGFGAIPRVLSRRDVDHRRVDKPKYDYKDEAQLVLERVRDLTDEQKMLVEFFDIKVVVAVQTITELLNKKGPVQAPFEALALYITGFVVAEHDAALVVWREKVRQDRVRTTTVIQAMDDEIETFAGPGAGVQTIKARDFQPYIRVMPHAEFPSGSACLCQAFMQFTDAFLEFHYNDTDSLSFSLNFPEGSSRIEPGLTPASDLDVLIPDFLSVRNACGQSRLDGGQHFTAAIDAGYELCDGIGTQIFEAFKVLTNGAGVLDRL